MTGMQNLDTLVLLKKEVAKILNSEAVDVNVGIGELGIDSLNVVELMVFCEQLYGAIEPERLNIGQYTTLQDLDSQLRTQAATAA